MPQKDFVVIGTSMGGVEALKTLVGALPADLPAAVCVVLHVGAYGIDLLPEILRKAGPLPVANSRDRMDLEPGHIYVAPPDQHLIVERPGWLRLSRGPKENRCRPAIDPLFRSAAVAYGPRAIGVILTGWLDDGAAGLWAIKERGGTAIVQSPEDAFAPEMPRNALKAVRADYCVPLQRIGPLLGTLTREPAEPKGDQPMPKGMELEVKIASEDRGLESGILEWGEPSVFACPECHGVLLQLKEGGHVRFRCHTGHAYSIESLLADFTEHTEETLWSALRSIEEEILLVRRMAEQLGGHEHEPEAARLQARADEAHQRAELVRQAILDGKRSPDGEPAREDSSPPAGGAGA